MIDFSIESFSLLHQASYYSKEDKTDSETLYLMSAFEQKLSKTTKNSHFSIQLNKLIGLQFY